MRKLSFLFLLLAACSSGQVQLGEAGDDTDVSDTGDAPAPSIEDWEGDWVGQMVLDAFGDDYFEGCEGDIELDVDDDGKVDGDGFCPYGDSGAELEFEGEVTADGELTGTMVIDFVYAGPIEVEVAGAAEDTDAIEADFSGTYLYETWGGDYEYDMTGTIRVERE